MTGDAVNAAARLEQAADPGKILIGGETMRLTHDAVSADPAAPLGQMQGEPVLAFRLVDVIAGAAGGRRRLDAPMVGRDRELD